ncbi:MAG TPA: hypothetical protein VNO81_10240 [Candidatus Nitrosotenuis sp.]|jgi:hypothetical protein|nr:hypothetical protein [Candidatus Nitrosotenuis sp.]
MSPPQTLLEVHFHPAARRPVQAAAVAGGVGMVLGGAWQLVGDPLVVGICGLLLVLSLSGYFLPTTYRFTSQGIEIAHAGGRRWLPWQRFRSFVADRNGFFLSPYRQGHPLEGLRGVFLPLAREDREAVRALLAQRLVAR